MNLVLKTKSYYCILCPAHYKFWYLHFCFIHHFGCVIFFTLNFRFVCLALLSKKNILLRNILVTLQPKTTKNQVTKMGWKAHCMWKITAIFGQHSTIPAIVYRRSLSYAPFFNWSVFIRGIQNFLNLVIWQPFFLGKFGYFRFSLRCTRFFFVKRGNTIIVFKHFIFVISIIVITARQEANAGKIGNQKYSILTR